MMSSSIRQLSVAPILQGQPKLSAFISRCSLGPLQCFGCSPLHPFNFVTWEESKAFCQIKDVPQNEGWLKNKPYKSLFASSFYLFLQGAWFFNWTPMLSVVKICRPGWGEDKYVQSEEGGVLISPSNKCCSSWERPGQHQNHFSWGVVSLASWSAEPRGVLAKALKRQVLPVF